MRGLSRDTDEQGKGEVGYDFEYCVKEEGKVFSSSNSDLVLIESSL